MNKEQFIRYMNVICDRYEMLNRLYDDVIRLTGIIPDDLIAKTEVSPMIDMLTEWSGDVTGWIDWFVYEKECGKKKLEVRDTDGTIVPSDNPEDIWNLIQSEKESE